RHVDAAGETGTRNAAPRLRRPDEPAEQAAADCVDGSRPSRFLQRTRYGPYRTARDNVGRAKSAQVVVFVVLAGNRRDGVSEAAQCGYGNASDAARRAAHRYGTVIGGEAVLLETFDRETGGEPGGAER